MLFDVPFKSQMGDVDLARLARTLDLTTHMYPKQNPNPTSPGVARLDHFSGLFLERGAAEGEWVLEARTWGQPAPASVHEWHLLAAGAAHELDPSVNTPVAHGRQLDRESRTWLRELRAEGPVRDAAIARLHALLLREARSEVRRRTAALAHPSGRDLEDLAVQAADDALMAILAKLEEFRGDALFTTWARRFAALEVPGEIRRRLGHAREAPNDGDRWLAQHPASEDPEQLTEVRDLARTIGRLIADELTAHQREVLLAMAVDEIPTDRLALRLGSTPGALYKALHDARAKLREELGRGDVDHSSPPGRSRAEHPAAGSLASATGTR